MLQTPDFFHNIRNLKFHFIGPSLAHTPKNSGISQTINLHQNLKKITLQGITNLDKVFEQLNVLESVHIIYYRKLQINESLQLLLQKYGDYLENFGYRFDSDSFSEKRLFELIIKYCKNIKFLDLIVLNNWIIYQLLNLTEDAKQNLNYLSINVINTLSSSFIESVIAFSSTILRNLGK
ncbi:hypothetical protein GLOIN_2v1783645 [Rhizophagus irregularis DAOM 181602=DAOM 197198]|nr:hypothetical protein GLOIN_2v1783645 [Rhizophagus irregularis DAOM 181602=DAOM 197198]